MTILYVIDFKCVLNFGEAQPCCVSDHRRKFPADTIQALCNQFVGLVLRSARAVWLRGTYV